MSKQTVTKPTQQESKEKKKKKSLKYEKARNKDKCRLR